MTSTAFAEKCSGRITGMSSLMRPSGNVRPCASQNERRKTLFQAMRSASSGLNLRMWVRGRGSRKTSRRKRAGLVVSSP